jgi:hypothetical protein
MRSCPSGIISLRTVVQCASCCVNHSRSRRLTLCKRAGNSTVKSRLDYMVTELRKAQEALGNGYLSAFPSSHFDRLEALKGVWAPFYVSGPASARLPDSCTPPGWLLQWLRGCDAQPGCMHLHACMLQPQTGPSACRPCLMHSCTEHQQSQAHTQLLCQHKTLPGTDV